MALSGSHARHSGGWRSLLRFGRRMVAFTAGVLLCVGCATEDRRASGPTELRAGAGKPDDFLVVDCLLPAQVRKLGRQLTYLAARQAIKTSARDCEIRGGEYVAYDRANYATALKVWLPLAQEGDQAAQTYVGEIFEKGLGVPPDYAAAAEWYRRAADRGYSRAAISLGNLYEQGLGVSKDPLQALNWYRRAAGLSELKFEVVPGGTSSELQQLRNQLAELRGQLQAKQVELDQARAERESEGRRTALQREISALSERLARAEAEASVQRAGLQNVKQQTPKGGPKIELIQVQLVDRAIPALTRDIKVRPVAASSAPASMTLMLVGRVTSEAGLKSVTLRQSEQILENFLLADVDAKENRFRVEIALTDPNRRLRIVAGDRNDRTSTLEFMLPQVASTSATARPGPPDGARARPPRQLEQALGSYHALVIGNNAYRTQIPQLRTAVNDAEQVAKLLKEQYHFQVSLLTNATRYEILSALNQLRSRLTTKDNLLIYYAGHGVVDEKNQRGYWLPVDAERSSNETWIANGDISAILNSMEARQLLVVADSCYSGTLTRSVSGQLEAGIREQELVDVIQRMAQKRSRLVMTSGGVEPVLDSVGGPHSAFAEIFIQVLRDNDGVILGREVFRRLQLQVAAMAERMRVPQVPEYAPIQYAGHEGGDFVFARPAS